MLRKLRLILEMIRFSHTIFALPFAMLAAVMAWIVPTTEGNPVDFQWRQLIGILVCMVGARSAAMAFNRWADRRIDADNPRTSKRHLPAKTLSVATVVIFTIASSTLFLAGTLLFWPNPFPLVLAFPVLGMLFGYSYAKRFTSLAHYWLGAALAMAPVAAWIAIRGLVVWQDPFDLIPALLLAGAIVFWVGGFDVMYACQDYEYDVKTKLRSIPARLGIPGALRLAAASHAAMFPWLVALPFSAALGGPEVPLGWIYAVGLCGIAGLLVFEHSVVSAEDLTRVNVAFFHVNAIVSVGLLLLVTGDLLW